DNDEQILKGMRLLLEGWGCRVRTLPGVSATGGLGLPGERPDIILADYHLDGENGLAAVRLLRQAWGLGIPAVLITADRSSEVPAAGEAMDIHVLNKPLKPAALRALLMRHRQMIAAESRRAYTPSESGLPPMRERRMTACVR